MRCRDGYRLSLGNFAYSHTRRKRACVRSEAHHRGGGRCSRGGHFLRREDPEGRKTQAHQRDNDNAKEAHLHLCHKLEGAIGVYSRRRRLSFREAALDEHASRATLVPARACSVVRAGTICSAVRAGARRTRLSAFFESIPTTECGETNSIFHFL